ncbi:TPA: hypothetical protein MB338_000438 [Klebsiella quasipneumoniae subsp. quasipneumoniae]|nr:hypothetical protein [Klebsiella quasipneumoniae subsp. quasipneumoniae]
MTAEIAVFNRSGVALAADSAVTTTNGFSEKIYNNADKLFELSKDHPVAVMIYNNAVLCHAPWEVLIKAYRKTLTSPPLKTIKEYSDSFFSFIENCNNIITSEMQSEYFKQLYRNAILPDILNKVQNEDVTAFLQSQNAFPSNDQYQQFIENRANTLSSKISHNSFYKDFDNNDLVLARQFASQFIVEICSQCIVPINVNGHPPYLQSLLDSLIELFALYTCKESDLETYSGIVIAGYGDDEYYPAIQSHHVYGLFNKKVMRPVNTHQNNADSCSGIMPFAQDDEVHTFMKGCSKGIINCVNDSLENSLTNLKNEVTNILTSQNPSLTRTIVETAFDSVIPNQLAYTKAMIDNHAAQNHIQKVLSILDSLAKVDLGYMAESLVNLTAFKRKVSNDSDSVGGPIDVAVLSKGDGFVWLKRKHYFDKDLNYRFFSRN